MTGDSVAGDELRQFIEQYEQLDSEKKKISELQKEVMAEAKARGYDSKIIRKVVALRRKSKESREEEQALLETYLSALGME